MKRAIALSLLAAAFALVLQTAASAQTPASGNQGELQLRVVSSPPHLISGGDARVEVVVPANVPFSEVDVELNGQDVGSVFGPDPEGGHELEGVVTGIAEGKSRLEASVPRANGRSRDRVLLSHRQLPVRRADVLRAAAGGLPLRDARERGERGTAAHHPVGDVRHADADGALLSRGLGLEPVHAGHALRPTRFRSRRTEARSSSSGSAVSSTASSTRLRSPSRRRPPRTRSTSRAGTSGSSTSSRAASASATTRGTRHGARCSTSPASRRAMRSRTRRGTGRRRTTTSSSAARRRSWSRTASSPSSRSPSTRSGSVPPAARSSSTSTGRTIRVSSTRASRSTRIRTWSRRRSTSATASSSSAGWTAKVIASPLSMWRTWANRSLIEGLNSSAVDPEPVRAPHAVHADARIDRVHQRLARALAARPEPALRNGARDHARAAGLGRVDALGRPREHLRRGRDRLRPLAVGQRRRPVRPRGAQGGPDNAFRVPRPERERRLVEGAQGHGPGGLPVHLHRPGRVRGGRVDVWSVRNQNVSPDGGATPALRREGNRKAQNAAYRSGMVFRGKIDIPLIDWRHYLEPFLDMHNSHQSFASRQRMLDFDGDASNQVIWFTDARPSGPVVRPDADGARRHRRVDGEHRRQSVEEAWAGTSRPTRSTVASRRTARRSRAATTCGTGSWTTGRRAPARRRSRSIGTSRIAAGGPIEGGIFACTRQPVQRAVAQGLYAPWAPTRDDSVARLREIFPDGVCDYTKGDLGRPPELKNGR